MHEWVQMCIKHEYQQLYYNRKSLLVDLEMRWKNTSIQQSLQTIIKNNEKVCKMWNPY